MLKVSGCVHQMSSRRGWCAAMLLRPFYFAPTR